nr:MAG TPA: hypothetical protein [Caudoviricetes sp.]
MRGGLWYDEGVEGVQTSARHLCSPSGYSPAFF